MSILRRSVKKLLRPFARPFLRPIFRRFEEVGRRLDEVGQMTVRLDRHLPVVENVIESHNAELRSAERDRAAVRAELDRLKDELGRARRQIEALRDDVAALSIGGSGAPEPVPDEPAALSPATSWPGEQEGELRLDFCCGPDTVPGHVGVDLRELRGTDLAASLHRLPFRAGSVEEIRATRVVERFSVAELREVVLPYWRSLLRPGGVLVAIAMDAAEELVRALLQETGFESIETAARRREDGGGHVEVRARRSGAGSMPVEVDGRTGISA